MEKKKIYKGKIKNMQEKATYILCAHPHMLTGSSVICNKKENKRFYSYNTRMERIQAEQKKNHKNKGKENISRIK